MTQAQSLRINDFPSFFLKEAFGAPRGPGTQHKDSFLYLKSSFFNFEEVNRLILFPKRISSVFRANKKLFIFIE